jgi:hypothetical protein
MVGGALAEDSVEAIESTKGTCYEVAQVGNSTVITAAGNGRVLFYYGTSSNLSPEVVAKPQ